MWWDDEEQPSVEVPLGDFFEQGHAETRNFASLPLCMSPQGGRGMTCYFPMPFGRSARIQVTNECESAAACLYYYIDYEIYANLHGTGTEDYFNTAWCPQGTFAAPYFGITMPGGPNWSGKISLYRYHIEDPIYFEKSLRVTIEHGHANRRSDDHASTAYWY